MRNLKILAWVHLVTGALSLLPAIAFLAFGFNDTEPDGLLVGIVLSGCFAAKAASSLVLGWALLALKPWSRMLGMILSVFHLPLFPIGTGIGIWGLIVLAEPETRALLSGGPRPYPAWETPSYR